jgi:hypothetical protein
MSIRFVSTFETTFAYKISTKCQKPFETNLECSLKTIRVHSKSLLVRDGPEESKGLLLRYVELVGLVIPFALHRLSEFFTSLIRIQLNEN